MCCVLFVTWTQSSRLICKKITAKAYIVVSYGVFSVMRLRISVNHGVLD